MEPALDDTGNLARADRDIAEVERRITRQIASIEALAAKGLDTASAAALLRLMQCDLEAMREHRRILFDDRGGSLRRSRSRPGPRTRRSGPPPKPPRSDDRGHGVADPDTAAAGSPPVWESLPNRALIARVGDRLLVVRPLGGKKAAFRFAVLKPLPENGGLLHVTAGAKRTAQEAMLAAERAVAAPPRPTAPALPLPPPAPDVDGEGSRGHPPPEALRVRLDPGMDAGAIEMAPIR